MTQSFPTSCARCNRGLRSSIMSRFNTDIICPECETKEKAHPRYQEAVDAEMAACKRGDYNYAGIGKPADL